MSIRTKLKIKLKGIGFSKAGDREGKMIRELDGLIIYGELGDGRPTTQVIPWDNDIELNAPGCVITTIPKKVMKEKPPIVVTCGICGEKVEAKTSQETIAVGMDHLKQYHKVEYDELMVKIAEFLEMTSQPDGISARRRYL